MNLVGRILLSRWVKGLLDKLPLDGKKTYLSLLLFFISAFTGTVCAAAPDTLVCQVTMGAHDFLANSLGIANMSGDAAASFIGTALIGLFHRFLKQFEKKKAAQLAGN